MATLAGVATIHSDNIVKVAGQSLTVSIFTVAVFGALMMYAMSIASLFRLRRTEPGLSRSFRALLYPYVPAFALAMTAVFLVALVVFNPVIFLIFTVLMVVAALASLLLGGAQTAGADDRPQPSVSAGPTRNWRRPVLSGLARRRNPWDAPSLPRTDGAAALRGWSVDAG